MKKIPSNPHPDTRDQRIEELERELAAYKVRGDGHAETLRSIARMEPATEAERMRLWARDGLTGYVEPTEVTLAQALDRAERAESALAEERRKTLSDARRACEAELLTDSTGMPEDEAYNAAVKDCVRAIEALIPADKPEPSNG